MVSFPAGAYKIGWLCALPIERTAATAFLDEEHEPLHSQPDSDTNSYTLGRLGHHNVVIACLPETRIGTNSIATVASHMRSTFPAIKYGLLVGIGGGIPSIDNDMRLGDIVLSNGVVQYDLGKTTAAGWERVGQINQPPTAMLTLLSHIGSRHALRGSSVKRELDSVFEKWTSIVESCKYPGIEKDELFDAEYDHPGGRADCSICDRSKLVRRAPRADPLEPKIHHGLIASGNQVMRHGRSRETFREEGFLCFEMEAAGLMNDFPCIVIRGICDYSDSHKNKHFQGYAAIVAAAYGKEVLSMLARGEPRDVGSVSASSKLDDQGHFGHHTTSSPGPLLNASSLPSISDKRTLRVQFIPSEMTVSSLLDCFPLEDQPFVQVKSLAPLNSPGNDGNEENMATITFSNPRQCVPRILKDIVIDTNFIGFTPLNKPKRPVSADIIAITGLVGHPFEAWVHPGSPKDMWLRDYIPKSIPNSRSLIYGYKSRIENKVDNKEDHGILFGHADSLLRRLERLRKSENCSERPLVIIAHSLGALIIKQALCDLVSETKLPVAKRKHPKCCWLLERQHLKSIIFLGAPHNGLDPIGLRTVIKPDISEALITELGPDSRTIQNLNKEFEPISRQVRILAVAETDETPTLEQSVEGNWVLGGQPQLIVSSKTASRFTQDGEAISADSQHSGLAQVQRGQDGIYEDLVDEIRECIRRDQDAPEIVGEQNVEDTRPARQHENESVAGSPTSPNHRSTSIHMPQMPRIPMNSVTNIPFSKPVATTRTSQMYELPTECDSAISSTGPFELELQTSSTSPANATWKDRTKGLFTRRYSNKNTLSPFAIHAALRKHDYAEASRLSECLEEVELKDPEHDLRTPLHEAALVGNVIVARTLLSKGASVDARTRTSYRTPLHYAAREGHYSVAQLLLDHGARPNAKSADGSRPLHNAAEQGRSDIVSLLLIPQYGTELHKQRDNGDAAIDLAVRRGHASIERQLRSKGARSKTSTSSVQGFPGLAPV